MTVIHNYFLQGDMLHNLKNSSRKKNGKEKQTSQFGTKLEMVSTLQYNNNFFSNYLNYWFETFEKL